MQITIFQALEGNWSIDRYAAELAPVLGRNHEVRLASVPMRRGLAGKIVDKHWRYLRQARAAQGERNLIVSEGYAFLLLALDPARTVCVCHDLNPLISPGRDFLYRRHFRLNLRIMARARGIIAVSEHTRTQLLQHLPRLAPEKVTTVHNGLHPRWRPLADREGLAQFQRGHGLPPGPMVLHVGGDTWYKNFPAVLRACALLQRDDWTLVKAGHISASSLRLAQELGISRRLVVLAGLSHEELVQLYNCAGVLVFPSLSEGFGWPPLEAMACGCPVIAANRASLPEVCGAACLYVPPEDPRAIAAAIERALGERPLRTELAQKGLSQAKKFSWEQTASRIARLL